MGGHLAGAWLLLTSFPVCLTLFPFAALCAEPKKPERTISNNHVSATTLSPPGASSTEIDVESGTTTVDDDTRSAATESAPVHEKCGSGHRGGERDGAPNAELEAPATLIWEGVTYRREFHLRCCHDSSSTVEVTEHVLADRGWKCSSHKAHGALNPRSTHWPDGNHVVLTLFHNSACAPFQVANLGGSVLPPKHYVDLRRLLPIFPSGACALTTPVFAGPLVLFAGLAGRLF